MSYEMPLNTFDPLPEAFILYFRINGMHFNKRMYEYAVSLMYSEDAEGNKKNAPQVNREDFLALMAKHGVKIPPEAVYDGMYVWSMTCADSPKSIPDERTRAIHVQEYLDDPDQRPGFVFNRFYNDTVWNGIPIDWDYVNG